MVPLLSVARPSHLADWVDDPGVPALTLLHTLSSQEEPPLSLSLPRSAWSEATLEPTRARSARVLKPLGGMGNGF